MSRDKARGSLRVISRKAGLGGPPIEGEVIAMETFEIVRGRRHKRTYKRK